MLIGWCWLSFWNSMRFRPLKTALICFYFQWILNLNYCLKQWSIFALSSRFLVAVSNYFRSPDSTVGIAWGPSATWPCNSNIHFRLVVAWYVHNPLFAVCLICLTRDYFQLKAFWFWQSCLFDCWKTAFELWGLPASPLSCASLTWAQA